MKRLLKIYLRLFSGMFNRPEVRLAFTLTIIVVVLSTTLLALSSITETYQYNIGDIAREDVRVSRDIEYSIQTETLRKKEQAAETAPLVFDKDQAVMNERLRAINLLFKYVYEVLQENPPIGTDDRTFQLVALKSKLPAYMQYSDKALLGILKSREPERMRHVTNRIMVYVMDEGILEHEYRNPLELNNMNVSIRTINATGNTSETSKSLNELVTLARVKQDISRKTDAIARFLPQGERRSIQDIVRNNIRANLSFNADETRRRINEAVKTATPVLGMLKRGQTIVREGDTVTTEALDKIKIINTHTASRNVNYIAGILLVQLMFLMIFGYIVLISYDRIFPDQKTSFIIFSLIIIFIVYTFFVARVDNIFNTKIIFTLLLPIPFITMMVAILNNIQLSMIVGLFVLFFSFAISGESSSALILAFSSALMGTFMARDIERRSGFLRTGLVIGLINAVIVIALGLMGEFVFADMLKNIQLALASGLINAILVLGVFPLYETIFGVTTNFKLLELSDLNASIFKKMLIKAPGTYNHSLMVANMAEAACKDIGANHLLARVGGYYHDIGKINDSGMYIENKITDMRAKTLSPREYSQLIISHVKKGVDKARQDNLPESVVAFIREHHGTSTMTYFYHQALEHVDAARKGGVVNKDDFQYPGPNPQSRETAVVMLADAIEAASRSLQEPTVEKLEGLVRKITYNKLNEGELEHSELTMSDLNKIQKSFLRLLNGIFHTRIEYPTKHDLETLEDRVTKRDVEY
ncbi:MAG TPA: HDIG domain-containing protein [Spirochaetota bacterium]|nr:HDIG domain-containing protein [Spirochaetota bacterium]